MYNDISLVINKEILAVIQEVAICPLCCGVISNPVQCSECENCFCKMCAYDTKRKGNGCPFGCVNFLINKSKLLSKLLSQLKFTCSRKCNSNSIPYEEIEEHYYNKCSLRVKEGEESYKTQYHPHLLIKHQGESHFRCDICKESVDGEAVCFSCRDCDFDYCALCKELEEEEKKNNLYKDYDYE